MALTGINVAGNPVAKSFVGQAVQSAPPAFKLHHDAMMNEMISPEALYPGQGMQVAMVGVEIFNASPLAVPGKISGGSLDRST